MFKSGKIHATVRIATGRDTGGLYRPYDKGTKTGENVIGVLKSKYPAVRIPDAEEFDTYP